MSTISHSTINASVGYGGKNNRKDVMCIQSALNKFNLTPLRSLKVDGSAGALTVASIKEFQTRHAGVSVPDGRVDVGGRTLQALLTDPKSKGPVTVQIFGKALQPVPHRVLTEVLQMAGLTSASVSSVERSPADQARIMYGNIKKLGAASQYVLYGINGAKVIKVYEQNAGKPESEVKSLMEAKINELGPTNVSHHISMDLYVFDVPWISVAHHSKFRKAVNSHPKIVKFIDEPANKCFHIEIEKLA